MRERFYYDVPLVGLFQIGFDDNRWYVYGKSKEEVGYEDFISAEDRLQEIVVSQTKDLLKNKQSGIIERSLRSNLLLIKDNMDHFRNR